MKKVILALSLSLCIPATFAAKKTEPVKPTPVAKLNSDIDKMSYTLGYDIGKNFKTEGLDVNPAVVYQGLVDATSPDKKSLLTAEQMQQTVIDFQKKMTAKKEAEFKALSDKNGQASTDFLNKNKSQSGVKVLKDGLQYKIEKNGSGVSPKEGDLITVNYVGSFVDGKEFDNSYKRGKPAVFKLSNDLIPGWVEALKMMQPGSKWMLYVPPNLGYGERGIGPIGPNQALVFDIELVSVKPDTK